jgi:hypothetical protein
MKILSTILIILLITSCHKSNDDTTIAKQESDKIKTIVETSSSVLRLTGIKVESIVTFNYDDSGRLIKYISEKVNKKEDPNIYTREYVYDGVSFSCKWYGNGAVYMTGSGKIDNNGNMTELTMNDYYTKKEYSLTTYIYENNLLKEENIKYIGQLGCENGYKTVYYYEDNNMIEKKDYDCDNVLKVDNYYEYSNFDKHNNWTKRTIKDTPLRQASNTTVRTIEYY